MLTFCVTGGPPAIAQSSIALPDLNGDGVADYFVRTPVWSNDTPVLGQFRVFSGLDHTLLKGFTSLQIDDAFAISTSSAGDFDGDGIDDVIVGAPLAIADGLPSGKIYIVSGADGGILRLITTPPWSYGGMTVAGLGDIDGDGVRDIAYSIRGATGPTDSGFVVVHSIGLDEPVMSMTGIPGDISFGYSIAFLGDTNNDNSPEIAVSSPDIGGVENARGSVRVFECRHPDGELRIEQTESDARLVIENAALPSAVFGGAMYLGPDIDGDGARELVIGSTVYSPVAEIAVIGAYDLSTAALVESLSIDAQKLRSDVNGDLVVDNFDIAAALDLMDQPVDPLNPKNGDVDGDGLVGAGDIVSVIVNLDQLPVTPVTFSNGQRAEVTDLVITLLSFGGGFPCMGVPPGLEGGGGGIIIPPEGPGEGGEIPIVPIEPINLACCIYKMLWLGLPPEDRPTPPAGCDGLGGSGGPGTPPRPRDQGWSDDENGNGGDDPPDCDGMSISGPSFIELGKSATYRVYGNPPGFLMWDAPPAGGPLQALGVSTQPTYLVKARQVGVGTVFAGVFNDNQDLACADSMTVTVIDCGALALSGPPQIVVGNSAYTVFLLTGDHRFTIDWQVDNGLEIVSSTEYVVQLRGVSPGVGRVRASLFYNYEPMDCDLTIEIPVVCDVAIIGDDLIADGQVSTYLAGIRPDQQVRWQATGAIAIVGPSDEQFVTIETVGCGPAELTARVSDAQGQYIGCSASMPITVIGSGPAQPTLTGLPPDGYLQLSVSGEGALVSLRATGSGPFTWGIDSSVDGAVEILAQAGNFCKLRVFDPTVVDVRVSREYCGEQQEVVASFTALVCDLAIDSNNDDAITIDDDAVEADGAGHILLSNTLDADADGIPDYADGIGFIPNYAPAATLSEGEFSPVVITLSDLEGLPFNAIELTYSASDPAGIHISDTEFFTRPEGELRLWRVPATTPRNPHPISEGGDFIPPGLYTLDTLGLSASGGEATLYLEAIRPTLEIGGNEIRIELATVGADAGADGPADNPSDLVVITTTEIEILARGKRDAEYFRHDVFVPTELPPANHPALPLPVGLQWGAWQAYLIRVHDPRSGFTTITVAGQDLPLIAGGGAMYVTAPFLCLDPANLPDGTPPGAIPATFPAGFTAVWLTPGLGVEIQYNPDGRVIRSKGLLAVTDETAELVELINNDIVPGMEAEDWVPDPTIEPPNHGSFGKEVHRRVTQRINGQPLRFRADLLIDKDTLQIISIGQGLQGTQQHAQIDAIAFADGYSPGVGDTIDVDRVKFAYEIKTGAGGLVDQEQRVRYVNMFGEQKFISIHSKRRWTLSAAWNDTPRVRHMTRTYYYLDGCMTKKLLSTLPLAGVAVPLVALVDSGLITQEVDSLGNMLMDLATHTPDTLAFTDQAIIVSEQVRHIANLMGAGDGVAANIQFSLFRGLFMQD
jgi:hypothetical protein